MKLAVDLHIHTALSPCSDNDMTPNNIVNMAKLKGLDVIGITDHNSAKNLRAVSRCGERSDIVVIPGIEIETMEEVHILSFFPDVEAAEKMQSILYDRLPGIYNREDIFGQQIIFDDKDNILGIEKRMLLTAVNLGIDEIVKLVTGMGGVAVPAHIDRHSYSITSNLGMVPDLPEISFLELSKNCSVSDFLDKHSELMKFGFITSSDAHHLSQILERECFIDIEMKSIKEVLNYLKRRCISRKNPFNNI